MNNLTRLYDKTHLKKLVKKLYEMAIKDLSGHQAFPKDGRVLCSISNRGNVYSGIMWINHAQNPFVARVVADNIENLMEGLTIDMLSQLNHSDNVQKKKSETVAKLAS